MAGLFAIVFATCLSLLSKSCACEGTERRAIKTSVKSINDVRTVPINRNDDGLMDIIQLWIQCERLECNMETQWCNTASGDGICSPCDTWCKDGENAGLCERNCPVYLEIEKRRRSAAITSVIEKPGPGRNLTMEESPNEGKYQESQCSDTVTWILVALLILSITVNLLLGAVHLVISMNEKGQLSTKCAKWLPWHVQQDKSIVAQPAEESPIVAMPTQDGNGEGPAEQPQAIVSHTDETSGNNTAGETSVKAPFSELDTQPSDEESASLLQQGSHSSTRPHFQMSGRSRATSSGIRNNSGLGNQNQPVGRSVGTDTDVTSVTVFAQSPQDDTEVSNPASSGGNSSLQTVGLGSSIPGSSTAPLLNSQSGHST